MIAAGSIDGVIQHAIQHAIQHPEQTIAALGTVVGAFASYQRTGRVPLGRVPTRYIRRAVRELGDRYFGKNRPVGTPGMIVDDDPMALIDHLRAFNFEDVDLYSYEYDGERWGLRRPEDPQTHPMTGEQIPMELHARGFATELGDAYVTAHLEANRFEAPGAHLDESMLDRDRGRAMMKQVLKRAGYEPRTVPSERQADVPIVD